MKFYACSDLHFTNNPQDRYRYDVFTFFHANRREDIRTLFLLGDLCDKKDRHPSQLVNKICDEIHLLGAFYDVWILMGNHDYIDRETPFFGFLDYFENVHFVDRPVGVTLEGVNFRFIPHGHDVPLDPGDTDVLLLHHPVRGAVYSNGAEDQDSLLRAEDLQRYPLVLSGDIHVPQQHGRNFHYCGAPYSINFGDSYVLSHLPRILEVDMGHEKPVLHDHHLDTTRRYTIDIKSVTEDVGLVLARTPTQPGDQIKLRLYANFVETPLTRIRQICLEWLASRGITYHKIEFVDIARSTRTWEDSTGDKGSDWDPRGIYDEVCLRTGTNPGTEEYDIGREIIDETEKNPTR